MRTYALDYELSLLDDIGGEEVAVMDPYLAKLISHGDSTTACAVIKRYWRGSRTFFLIKGILSAEQRDMLTANMERLRAVQQAQYVQDAKTESGS